MFGHGRIAKATKILMRIEPVETLAAVDAKGWIPPGDVVQVMKTSVNGTPWTEDRGRQTAVSGQTSGGKTPEPSVCYVLVVNGDLDTEDRSAPVNVSGNVVKVVDLVTRKALPMSAQQADGNGNPAGRRSRVCVPLAPGDGTLLELTM